MPHSSPSSPGPALQPRHGPALMAATRPFMDESRMRSWWNLLSTFLVLGLFASAAVTVPWWPLRLAASVGMALTMVRAFILFHDLQHNAIFRNAPWARTILEIYGLLLVTPPRIWRKTHNYHHAHTARTEGPQRGTYTLFTVAQWRAATWSRRLHYRIEHHPLTILFGYLSVFILTFGLLPFLRQPLRHWDSGFALLLHVSLGVAVYALGGGAMFLFAFLLPFLLAGAVGAYLFYVQHYFEGIAVPDREDWTHERAALEASSYLRLGPVMRWFTGNIGFHHVHHLNPRIPFYRLPAAMASLPELEHPVEVTLGPRTILSSLRLKLWDPARRKMVGYAASRS